ncbi:peptide ABC transporter substrate-binding protein [Aliidongia dinghuensis]|uniref:Peptide ABC transporter substrate-binding protein n=1 Tax=Aliidongia dinghuensis TaxID=1867774 RepID=A0A8J2YRC1_9PROT|nr:peptide ABC transporter substrate-binding protein [Aliidongia dinghuensis]GGF09084.1 peptide ABC transporter substrate-binding protein [Aliidongia dinghuensis]
MRALPSVIAAVAALQFLMAPAQAGQVLHRISEAEPETLDPQKSSASGSLAIDRDMFIGLLTLDPQEHVVPGVAEKWEISPDGKTWTFHLRHDAKWSTGEPVTSQDFVYSFRRLVDPKTAAADSSDLTQLVNYQAIASGQEKDLTKFGVEAADPYTLVLHLTEPRLALKFLLTDPMLFPLHKASVEKWGAAWTQPEHLVGNGPFVMKSWVPQSSVVLTKSPTFFDAASVKLDEVDWIVTESTKTALTRFRAGELDFDPLAKNDIPWARQNAADQLVTADVNGFTFLFFNMTKGPFKEDVRLREAFNLAVDRETLVTKVDPRGEKPAYGVIPPVTSDYTQQSMDFKDMPQADRLTKAKGLMKEAGYGPDHPLKVKVTYPTEENNRQLLLAIAAMVKPIGVDLALDNMEWQVFIDVTDQRNFEVGYLNLVGTYDDYENGLDNFRSTAGTYNVNGYANAKFDDLFHRGGTSTDPLERRHLMEQAEKLMLNDYPVVPLEFYVRNVLVNPKLQGYVAKVVYNQSRYLSFKQ